MLTRWFGIFHLPLLPVCVCVCTNRQVGEDAEGAVQKSNQVDQVVAGAQTPASRGRGHPVVVGQLQELVDLGVEVGIDLRLCCMASVLKRFEDLALNPTDFGVFGKTKQQNKGK